MTALSIDSREIQSNVARDADDAVAVAAVHANLRAVWRYLRMQGASADEADDLAQECFVIAARKNALGLDAAATATFLRRTEIAKALGLQENGVKTLMQRARQQLRDCLDRRHDDR